MDTRLTELRNQISEIDREIVTALAQRSRLNGPTRPGVPPVAAAVAFDDDTLAARIRSEYARAIPEQYLNPDAPVTDAPACEAADRTLLDAVHRRVRVALQVARAKAAGQTPQFRALVATRDVAGLEQAITQPAIEEQVIARALSSARELQISGLPSNFPDRVAAIYRDWIIPLARRVQVETLLAGKG